MSLFDKTFFGNSLLDWAVAAGVVIVSIITLEIIKSIATRKLTAVAKRTETELDDLAAELFRKVRFFFLLAVSVYFGSFTLTLTATPGRIVQVGVVLALLLQGAIWGNSIIGFWIIRATKQRLQEDAASATTFAALGFIGKLILWTVFFLLTLDNLGINITALIAGMGIGGIAVALALQNILGDLFASLSIVLDKPFVIGDFIIVDEYLGTVEHIGLKTTRVRSLSGEQVIFSNSDLLKSRVRNFKRMYERRVLFSVGVTYQTPHEKLAQIPAMIRRIIEAQDNTRFDRCHFTEYGDSALLYETVYFVKNPNFNVYMDIQQAINLAIYKQFEESNIQFAYPTRTLFINHESNLPSEDATNREVTQHPGHNRP